MGRRLGRRTGLSAFREDAVISNVCLNRYRMGFSRQVDFLRVENGLSFVLQGGIKMRYYSVTFKNNLIWMYNEKSDNTRENDELESDKDAGASVLEQLKTEIEGIPGVEKAEVADGGHILGIEAAEEDFPAVLNNVVNLFRRFDESSIVTYDFQLNME